MWQYPSEQLEAIHAMLTSGHRSVRMERHTLVLWGVGGAALILALRVLITPERFPVHWERIAVSTGISALTLLAVGIWDYWLTRRARAARDETLSFIQSQVRKVWWLMVALIVLLNVGMSFFGGGYLFYAIVLALMGIAFYVHGLFSAQMLSWIGLSMVALGLAAIALQMPFALLEWLAICTFGLGLPLLAFLLHWEPANRSARWRAAAMVGWLAVVSTSALACDTLDARGEAPDLPVVTLAAYRAAGTKPNALPDPVVVRLAAGTEVPVALGITGDGLARTQTTVPLKLSEPLDLVVHDGHPTGRYRLGDGPWRGPRLPYRIRDFRLHASVPPGQAPAVSLHFRITQAH